MRQRWEMYEQNGNIVIEAGMLFKEASWFAVLHGQGLQPRGWHPFADIPSDAELARRFGILGADVEKRVATFPSHDEYLRKHCQAPPMVKEKMA